MGAGPRLIKLAGQYADGWMSVAPNGVTSPEAYAERVRRSSSSWSRPGGTRSSSASSHADAAHPRGPDIVDRVFDNNVIKFFASIFGRVNQADWAELGVESPFPPDYNYSLKFLP